MAEKIVYVTNTSNEDFQDAWDGKRIDFPVGETVALPEPVAAKLFGYGQTDRTPQIARLGWSATHNDLPKALERLDKFVISKNPPQKKKAA